MRLTALARLKPTRLWSGRPRIEIILWVLFALPILHIWLLQGFDLNSPPGIAAQVLRPIGTAGAAALLVYIGLQVIGPRRIAWMCIGTSTFLSVLFSSLKIVFDVSVANPFMRVLWVFIYGSALVGAVAYVLPNGWPNRRQLNSALRVLIGCITVGCAVFGILHGGFLLYDPVLSPGNLKVINLPTISFDVAFVFALGLIYRDRPAVRLTFLCVFCVFVADVLHLYISLRIGADVFQGRSYVLFPLYTLQSIILAYAAWKDIQHPQVPPASNDEIGIHQWVLWTFFPLTLALLAFFLMSIARSPLYWLFIVLAGSLVAHGSLTVFDYYRALHRQEIAYQREHEARQLMRGIQHELRNYADSLKGLVPLLEAEVSPDGQPTLHFLHLTTRNIDDLLQQLLVLSREGTLPPLQMTAVPVRNLLEQEVTRLSLHQPDVHATIDCPDLVAHGDSLYLALAMRTALRNAVEAMERTMSGSEMMRLHIRVTEAAGRVIIRIEDTGPGFPPALLTELHTRRNQDERLAPGWSSKAGGHGLGLALIDRVTALHSGAFRLGNRETGYGAWIELDLPEVHADQIGA